MLHPLFHIYNLVFWEDIKGDEISYQMHRQHCWHKVNTVAIDKFEKFQITALNGIEWHRDKDAKQSLARF